MPVRTCTGNLASVELDPGEVLQSKTNQSPEEGLLTGKLIHLALPVRWSPIVQEGRGPAEMACTYDIHPHGARLLGTREVNIGDMVMVERGRNKAVCQVVWAADAASALRGQFTVQCVEGKTPWDEELRQLEEQYQPIDLETMEHRLLPRGFGQVAGQPAAASALSRRRPGAGDRRCAASRRPSATDFGIRGAHRGHGNLASRNRLPPDVEHVSTSAWLSKRK